MKMLKFEIDNVLNRTFMRAYYLTESILQT